MKTSRNMLLVGLFLSMLPACASLKNSLSLNERHHAGSHAAGSDFDTIGTRKSNPPETLRTKEIQLISDTGFKNTNPQSNINKPPIPEAPQVLPLSSDPLASSVDENETGNKQPEKITLDLIEQLSLAHNPSLAQANANVDAANGGWLQAGLYPNPQVGFQANEVGNGGNAGQQGVYVSQEIVRGNKLALSQHAAAHQVGRLEANREAQRYRILTSARIAYYEMLIAQQRLTLAKELVRIGEEGVKTTKALVEARQVSKIDQLQAQVELNKARIIERKARNRKRAAWTELATTIGRPNWKMVPVTGTSQPVEQALDAEVVIERILASSPELAAARQEIARSHAALQRARVEPIPNVTIQTGLQYDFGTRDPIANLQVGLPLPVRNRNEGNIQKAYAQWMAASRNVERLELALKNRLASVLEQYGNASYQTERFTKSVLPDAKQTLDLVSQVYKRGEANYLRLLTAQRTYFQTKMESLDAQNQWWRAKLQIDGLLLNGGLNTPDE